MRVKNSMHMTSNRNNSANIGWFFLEKKKSRIDDTCATRKDKIYLLLQWSLAQGLMVNTR